MFIISGLDKDLCTEFGGKMQNSHAKFTWPKIKMSSPAWHYQRNVGNKRASISETVMIIILI